MGKRHKKARKDPIISELEEREKIKQSVLQVFRDRLKSPGEGGAIVVGKAKSNKNSQSESQTLNGVTYESTSSMTDSEASTESGKRHHKRRRRKKRQKPQKKVKKVETERHDVAKHLKIANDIRHAVHAVTEPTKVCMISQNRLTRKMGLFNRGKKSSTISRDIIVPESVKKKTQDDLKKILQQTDEEDTNQSCHNDSMNISHSPLTLPKPSGASVSTAKRSDLGYRSAGSAGYSITPSSTKLKATVSSASCLSTASSEDVRNILPEDTPMEDISEILIRSLNLRQFFPGRNIFEETVEDLRKIMKQNSFSTTPMSKRLKSKEVDSVKRSLMDRYSPKKQDKPSTLSGPSSAKYHNSNIGKSPHILMNHKKTLLDDITNKQFPDSNFDYSLISRNILPKPKSPTSQQLYSKEYLYDKVPAKCTSTVTYARSSSFEISSIMPHSPRKFHKNDLVDGKTLLKCNEDMIAEACQQMEQLSSKTQSMETNMVKDDGLRLLQQNELKRDILSLLPNDLDITQQSSQSSGYHGSQNSRYGHDGHTTSRRMVNHNIPNAAVTDFMPQFHDRSEDHSHKENCYESMDILDYLDGPPKPEPRSRKQKNPKHIVTSPDSDGIQMWVPSNVHVLLLPKKPTFDSPSPEKMRPRFMH